MIDVFINNELNIDDKVKIYFTMETKDDIELNNLERDDNMLIDNHSKLLIDGYIFNITIENILFVVNDKLRYGMTLDKIFHNENLFSDLPNLYNIYKNTKYIIYRLSSPINIINKCFLEKKIETIIEYIKNWIIYLEIDIYDIYNYIEEINRIRNICTIIYFLNKNEFEKINEEENQKILNEININKEEIINIYIIMNNKIKEIINKSQLQHYIENII